MTLRNRLQQIYGEAAQPPSNGLRNQLKRMEQRRKNLLPQSMAEFLGGDWMSPEQGRVLSVQRRFSLGHCHGRIPLQRFLKLRSEFVRLLAADPDFDDFSPSSFLFLDTETTGLSGGAGTYVFLVGVGFFEGREFILRQFFLPDYSSERAFLQELANIIAGAFGQRQDPTAGRRPPVTGFRSPFRQLVSFNGKSYDLNLLANRFVLQRLANPFGEMQHLDLIHPCRTLWRGRFENCALQTLEREVLGFERDGDIPSAEIPQTYFRFLRSGNYRPFREVFEHNRLDILSMVGLLATASSVIEDPVAHDFADPLSAARLHQLRGNLKGAALILGNALEQQPGAEDRLAWMRELALLQKRLGHPGHSLTLWKEYLRCHPAPCQEAFEECAKILEHQRKDFEKALQTVQLGLRNHPANPSLSHRRHRLECKIAGKRWW